MNLKNWSPRKKLAALVALVLAIVGIVVTIYLVQRQQELRGRAERATTLELTPANQNVSVNSEAKLDVIVNRGINKVSFVKFTLEFDPTKFDPDVTFTPDAVSSLSRIQDDVVSEGRITVTLGAGSNPSNVITTTKKLGTISLTAGVQNETQEPSLISGPTQISFDEEATEVRSIAAVDEPSENVLASTTPATVTIVGACVPDVGTCSWDQSEDAISYRYKVTNVTDNEVVEEGEVDASVTLVEFPTNPGKTYKCEVTAVNDCAASEPSDGQATCQAPSGTPTPGPSATPTPTGRVTSTPTPTKAPTNTPTPTRVVSTPTPTEEVEEVPTPTEEIPEGGIETPTPTTPGEEFVPTETPVPTLPPTGNPVTVVGIIGGILFVLGGLALLFL